MGIRIAVDAMGGDYAPGAVVEGVLNVLANHPNDLEILLCGPGEQLRQLLSTRNRNGNDRLPVEILDAPDVIGMGESPATAVKTKQRSSIHVGLTAHHLGQADAFVSAGNTGAVMAASLFILGRQPNVARPSVIGFFPTTESYCIVLDVGANIDCKPEHMVQFAQMGTIYARRVMKRENPVVALLNVGEEPGKGTEQVRAAFELLEQTPGIHFRGNIEGRDIFCHSADVVVCDGFVGNILLKFGESMATTFTDMVAKEMLRQQLPENEQMSVKKVLRGIQRRFDFEEYGGAPLLGVNGNVIIGHGSSSPRAVEKMITAAADLVEENIAGTIADTVNR